MRMAVPKGRANYQPNSWGEGPRESPSRGFRSFASEESGPKLRVRAESFADHYSQARQFYISQAAIEQAHIAAALVFELSKVETVAIRSRVVGHLRNIDEALAAAVAAGLRLKQLPEACAAARPTRVDLEPSPALSIVGNPPPSFAGRKVGVLVTDGVDATLLGAIGKVIQGEGAMVKVVAPNVGGVEASDGTWIEADERLAGGPSVLFDAVVLLPSAQGVALLAREASARDFVSDAYAHLKCIGYGGAAEPLLKSAGIWDGRDEGFVPLNSASDAEPFLAICRKLRIWSREAKVQVL